MSCSVSRYIMIAFAVGLVTSTITGSDMTGLLAAVSATAIAFALGRWAPARFGGNDCRLPAPEESEHHSPIETSPSHVATERTTQASTNR